MVLQNLKRLMAGSDTGVEGMELTQAFIFFEKLAMSILQN
jgi:hypothetical protein